MEFTQEKANELNETNLRQAEASFNVQGILSEKSLERGPDKYNPSREVIKGQLVVQTDEFNFVTIDTYVANKKNDGGDNPAFAGMVTIMENYKSIAEVGAAQATRVRTAKDRGQLRPNTYFDPQGIEHHNIRYNCNYFNTIRNGEKYTPEASFKLEMVISNIRPETYTSGENLGEETGRYIVEGWVPTYNGIEPVSLIAPVENGIADSISSVFSPGDTTEFYGDIINSRITQTTETSVIIGKPRIETTSRIINELVITGAVASYSEEPMVGCTPAYNLSTIQAAINVREEKMIGMKNDALHKAVNTDNGFINVPQSESSRKLPF